MEYGAGRWGGADLTAQASYLKSRADALVQRSSGEAVKVGV